MDWFLFQPGSVRALTQLILSLVIALYLFGRKRKSLGTWLLGITFGAFSLAWLQLFFETTFYGTLPFAIGPLDELALPIVLYCLLFFAYTFVDNTFPREARIVLTLLGLTLVANTYYQLSRMIAFGNQPDAVELGLEVGQLLMVFLTLSVYLRKLKRAKTATHLSDPARTIRALRAFALLTLFIIPVSLRGVWSDINAVAPSIEAPAPFLSEASFVGFVLLLVALMVVFINHAPEPTTFQVKLVGFSLATVLALLSIADLILFNTNTFYQESKDLIADQQTLRFVPDGNQGYHIAHVPYHFDPNLGTDLEMGLESDSLVSLGFAFPFYGKQWEAMYIDSNGLVAFGGAYLTPFFDDFFTNTLPKIAPYYRALVPLSAAGSGIYYKREADKATVTWRLVRENASGDKDNRNTIQLVLYDTGVIDFVYDRLEAPLVNGLRGLHPGGPDIPYEPVQWSSFPPETVTAATLPEKQLLRFERDTTGTYTSTRSAYSFDPNLGQALKLSDNTNAKLGLGFAFPYYDATWDSLYASANGTITFGDPLNPPDSLVFQPPHFHSPLPKIAPFFVDLHPEQGSGVFYKREADKATLTWHRVPQQGTSLENTVQLVLHADGTVDFAYDRVTVPLYDVELWGLYPGDTRTRPTAADYLFDYNASHTASRATLFEAFGRLYLSYVHSNVVPLAYVVLFSTLFILVVFPLFFQTSLIKPLGALLQSVQRVDDGDLDVQVPVHVNDEIGRLGRNFNHMTTSLKKAHDELEAYAEGLEEKVAERTQELETSLQQLKKTQDQLIHAEKMASLGKLTAGIAHEIKNPLNFVNNFASLSVELVDELQEELDAQRDKPVNEVADDLGDILADLKLNATKINEHGQRADSIVKGMLEHSRSQPSQRIPTDLNKLLDEYVNLAYHGMRANEPEFNVTIEQQYDEEIGEIDLVPQEMGRVFLNLLNNAFYALHQYATEAVSSSEPRLLVCTRKQEDHVEIIIQDNGPGIPEDVKKHIFEPFFTTKPTGQGNTGLGLSLSYDIVTQGHNGTFTVESKENEGATFTIRLPL